MNKQLPVEISARHVHLSAKDFEKLYGKGKSLILINKLSQPGEFASKETLTLINKNNKIKNVRILGPFREKSQVELSLTDSYNLKLNPLPNIRVSGDIAGTTSITARGPKGEIKIPAIIAQRHLHCTPEQAKKLNLKDKQNISLNIDGQRKITFHNIIVRISKNYNLSVHLDTDEANSAGIKGKTFGKVVK